MLRGGWITINGTHVPLDKDGGLQGSIGEKISGGSPRSAAKTMSPNPEKPKKPNYKRCSSAISKTIKKLGGQAWEEWNADIMEYELPGKVNKKDFANNLSNSLRESGYKTSFYTESGKYSEKPTTNFAIESNKEFGYSIDVNIMDGESEAKGKTYLAVQMTEVY